MFHVSQIQFDNSILLDIVFVKIKHGIKITNTAAHFSFCNLASASQFVLSRKQYHLRPSYIFYLKRFKLYISSVGYQLGKYIFQYKYRNSPIIIIICVLFVYHFTCN